MCYIPLRELSIVLPIHSSIPPPILCWTQFNRFFPPPPPPSKQLLLRSLVTITLLSSDQFSVFVLLDLRWHGWLLPHAWKSFFPWLPGHHTLLVSLQYHWTLLFSLHCWFLLILPTSKCWRTSEFRPWTTTVYSLPWWSHPVGWLTIPYVLITKFLSSGLIFYLNSKIISTCHFTISTWYLLGILGLVCLKILMFPSKPVSPSFSSMCH